MSKSKINVFNILLKFVLAVILIAVSVFAGIVIDKRVLTKEQGSNSDITINKPSDSNRNNHNVAWSIVLRNAAAVAVGGSDSNRHTFDTASSTGEIKGKYVGINGTEKQ